MKTWLFRCILSMIWLMPACLLHAQSNSEKIIQQKIAGVIKQLTLEEKISLLHANSIFGTAGVPRLGIPGLMTDDGPLGVREDVLEGWGSANLTTDSATYFPNGSAWLPLGIHPYLMLMVKQ